jgi:hypothetical protein
MRLRQLFENKVSEVAIIFGRFNPPHKGHKAAWELASKSPVWYVGTNESTVGPKDPLPYDVKVEAMKTIWPEVESHIVAETGWLTLASKVYQQYPDATLLCLTDEDWVTKTIQQYNGKEGQHGFYNFKNIEQKPTPRLSSATALRDAVTNGDRDAFSKAAGVDADTPVAGKPFFDLVAEYLLPYANAPKKVAKKKAPAEDISEASRGQKFIVTYYNSLSNDSYTVMVSADDEYDAKDKVRYALGMGDRVTGVKPARGNEPTDREYKVFVDPRTSQSRSGIYDRDQGMSERVRDPEDWDEGNTEPPNNFAVYINGKKWKVFQGRGQFADDYKEMQQFRQLQTWAQQKSSQSGKKWEVYKTGEPPTV